ncbi:hypothetical protein GCM10025783_02820 [Amnibacterium soli]|uniref:Uncharacterized protein n=1 Tax=Amnibacterium soli TaxID=1282736 RepID=A0ABP8YPJ3_9MICO
MLLPAGIALLAAVAATIAALAEVLAASRARRPLRGPHLAAAATVAVFALATTALLGVSATASPGRPARYTTAPQPALQPEALLVVAGAVALVGGLIRADRTARTAERAGGEVAQAVRATNVVLVLAGVGLVVLGVVALAV